MSSRGVFERGDTAVNDHEAIGKRLREISGPNPFAPPQPHIVSQKPTVKPVVCASCITPYTCGVNGHCQKQDDFA